MLLHLINLKALCAKTAFAFIAFVLFAGNLWAKAAPLDLNQMDTGLFRDPVYLLFFLIGIALLPFIAIMLTSFAKIVVVLSITRQAIGTAQTPPNIVIMSLSILLTCFSMYPVGLQIYNNIDPKLLKSTKGSEALFHVAQSAEEPLKTFLTKHAKKEDRDLFLNLLKKGVEEQTSPVSETDFIILAPAFLISELSLAFQIGFLIYLPFLVIDMTVANLLMALGMQMLAPTTISLPFKILLFVLVDGFRLLSESLAKV